MDGTIFYITCSVSMSGFYFLELFHFTLMQGSKKGWSDCPGQVNFPTEQVTFQS